MSAAPRSGSSPIRRLIAPLVVVAVEAALLALGLGSIEALRDPRAITLLALSAAGGYALQLMQPMRGHDATTSEPDAGPMVVLLLAPLFAPMVGALGARLGWAMLPSPMIVSWASLSLVGVGLLVRIAAIAQLGPRFSPIVAVQRNHALETRGLYSRIRHPGYLGALLACLGASLAFGSALALPLVLAMRIAHAARIRREEALLARHFGEAWGAYVARTGSLLPRFGPTH